MMDFTTPPYLLKTASVQRVMLQVLAALLPGIAAYIWLIGPIVLVQLAIATLAALAAEAAMLKLRDKPLGLFLGDGSAVVTAWLIALTFPPLAPWWLLVVGVLFAIVIAKHLYGGLGQNPFNPAMIAFAVCIVSFPALMSQWPALGLKTSFGEQFDIVFGLAARVDAMTGATPLDAIKTALKLGEGAIDVPALLANQDLFGNFAGRGWEWVAAGYLIGRFLPRSARPAIRVAAFISAALIVVAMPGVLGYGRSPDLPSALPRNSLAGLAAFLGITWLAAAGYLLAQAWHTCRRPAKTP